MQMFMFLAFDAQITVRLVILLLTMTCYTPDLTWRAAVALKVEWVLCQTVDCSMPDSSGLYVGVFFGQDAESVCERMNADLSCEIL